MKRIFPKTLRDKIRLSQVLEQYLIALNEPPMEISTARLAFETRIPEQVFIRLAELARNPADADNIEPEDFHILFSNICFRYPTVRIWQQPDGGIYIEM